MMLAEKLGVFVRPGFLDAAVCEEICQQMAQAPCDPMTVYNPVTAQGGRVDPDFRQTSRCHVRPELYTSIARRLKLIQNELEQHFCQTLIGIEPPLFAIYRRGDFFRLHDDDALGRKVNISIFLNDTIQDDPPGGYAGGTLVLYGLIDKPGWQARGIPIAGKRGMLVAYASQTRHEVTPVTNGERFAIITHVQGADFGAVDGASHGDTR